MQVILLERVERLGQMGDEVRVKDGFARNFLLPQKKALRATKANREYFSTQKAHLEARNLERKAEAEAVAKKLEGQIFTLIRQAGDRGHLYGSVSPRDIADAISVGGFNISRTQVPLNRAIKEIGLTPVNVVLHPEVRVQVTINIARTEDEAERQARGEDVLAEQTPEEEVVAAAEELFEEGATPKEEEAGADAE
ncbi:MAG: 50S ribosomal protein L9 [Alphaproteobacteria bacterium]|jgi:large subunit ribosomal protein L9|nr:50S ribosomal protein L9 [Alphaproteobacteria bacterium]MBN9556533.1 50S ribosomal protein L9 [Alphaproteobacteria bacterium]MBN9578818.1 50S ribosomal protein L9 [Alphaproteobacteria bacterium]